MNYYTNEPDILELLSLLKAHKIYRAIVSPGSTNISLAASLLYDSEFEVFSAVDERSAAYMACGLAAETGEPVIICCTGATAARNYVPALTEAYYRHLPVLTVACSQHFGRVGQYFPQVTDRSNPINDIFVKHIQIPIAVREEDKWANNLKINDALLALRHRGGGPVLINIETSFSSNFDVKQLPHVRVIKRVSLGDTFPKMASKRIIIFVGSHAPFSEELSNEVDLFCSKNNAVVICDHTSNYKGKYRALGGLTARQAGYFPACKQADLIIHMGEVSGAYYGFGDAPVWRISKDGEVRDTFKHLTYVFDMDEKSFFMAYNGYAHEQSINNTFVDEWKSEEKYLLEQLPELPFSNAWIAQQTTKELPEYSEIHFGILNSLRMWNLFELPGSVNGFSNVGGFGIDGCISSALGASLYDKNKLYFLVIGDLATFYDLNALGNRHVGNNLRIMIVNNGLGFEMRHNNNRGNIFKDDANILFAAAGHFGNQSRELLRHFATDLGFEYMKAESKEEYLEMLPHFVSTRMEKSIVFEVFVDVENENEAYDKTMYIVRDSATAAKRAIKNILGEKGVNTIKNMLKRSASD